MKNDIDSSLENLMSERKFYKIFIKPISGKKQKYYFESRVTSVAQFLFDHLPYGSRATKCDSITEKKYSSLTKNKSYKNLTELKV